MIKVSNELMYPTIEAPNGQSMQSFFPIPAAVVPIASVLGVRWHDEMDIWNAVEAVLDKRGDKRDFFVFTSDGVIHIYPYERAQGDTSDDEPYDVYEAQRELVD